MAVFWKYMENSDYILDYMEEHQKEFVRIITRTGERFMNWYGRSKWNKMIWLRESFWWPLRIKKGDHDILLLRRRRIKNQLDYMDFIINNLKKRSVGGFDRAYMGINIWSIQLSCGQGIGSSSFKKWIKRLAKRISIKK